MKNTHSFSENRLFFSRKGNQVLLYTQTNLNQSETWNRLLKVVCKVLEQPHYFEEFNLLKKRIITPHPREHSIGNQKQVEQRIDSDEMDIEDLIEEKSQQPKLQKKTSIQNRISSLTLNPEEQDSFLSISALPAQNWKIHDCTVDLIDTDGFLNIQHLQSLFKVEQTDMMVLTLAYLIKLSFAPEEKHPQMNSNLRKFAACYLVARKISEQFIESRVISETCCVLGLDADTLLLLQRQFLISINFELELTKQDLDKVAKILFD